ncbi:hypothetical protein PYW07_003210 [Mythimna separata]|uniref:Uncharacterized protein n=1 Tax=Mythimna separata TaxID=271217 RepID=A0AAD7YHI7_MYTSE|nr:hypothetical protein PYW07_003210 [Mythimna separata]
MLRLNVILLASAIFAFCDSLAILDKLNKKCAVSDDKCVVGLYKSLIVEAADNGIPELGVPKADPLMMKDMEVVALGMIKLTVKEGEAKGFRNCEPTDSKVDLANQRHTISFVCERIAVEASYKIESTPTLLALIGGIDVHGEGKGGAVLEQITLNFDFGFELKKLDDGEVYIQIKPDDSTNSFEVKGKATVHADNILVGKQEISAVVVNIFNENWEFFTNNFGKTVIDNATGMFMEQAQLLLNKIPVKDLITDDVSAYVKS